MTDKPLAYDEALIWYLWSVVKVDLPVGWTQADEDALEEWMEEYA